MKVSRYRLVSLLSLTLFSTSVFAQEIEKKFGGEMSTAAMSVAVAKRLKVGDIGVIRSAACVQGGEGISCPTTRTAAISTDDCFSQNYYIDFYRFSGTSGQTVTINVSSSAFDTTVALLDPNGGLHAENDDANAGTTNSQLISTLNVSGNWIIGVTSYDQLDTGNYTLTLSCGTSQTGCTQSSTNLCLANNRFRVETHYRTSNGTNGAGQAVSLTGDTGYFWFFNNANVEVVIKVLNACGFGAPRYWVFSGGLTDVEVDITVTDTLRGNVKTYHNNLGTAFQPIQDTNAFATCP